MTSKLDRPREGHLERTAGEPREEGLLSVKIGAVTNVNERIRLVRLALHRGAAKFLAGQWLDTFVPDQPKPGGFTITSAPSMAARQVDPYLELAVQDAPENPAAAWLWRPDSEILGQELSIRVGGSFVLPPSEGLGNVKRIVLIAGGVGINPLVSMLGYLSEQKRADLEICVLYASKLPKDRSLRSVLFLERIAAYYRGGLICGSMKLFATGSGNETLGAVIDELGIEMQVGRISMEDVVVELRKNQSPTEGLVYICGPPSMTDDFVEGLTAPTMASIIDRSNVKSEKWW